MTALFTLPDLLAATQAKVFNRTAPGFDNPFEPASISTDARTLKPGQVFLPLVGDRFDGHDYRQQAYDAGAVASFMQADHSPLPGLPNQLIVADTLLAYQWMARHHRRRVNTQVVAITGSSGKTTTKTMFYTGFKPFYVTQCTQKNHNNDIGVAQTLLDITLETQLAIVEMGMRGPGEITRLTLAAEPDIAVITNIGPAHIERLGSLEAIAAAKCEIVKGLNPTTGVVIANGDDALLMHTLRQVWPGRLETFSRDQASQVQNTTDGGCRFTTHGQVITLNVPGDHMILNALAVITAATLLNAPLDRVAHGLATYQPEDGRYALQALPHQVHVIQDAYNANPSSMEASLSAFLNQPSPIPGQQKSLILAGMNELGDWSTHYHAQLGHWLALHAHSLTSVLLIGQDCLPAKQVLDQASCTNHYWVDNVSQAQDWLLQHPLKNQFVLVKGSRSYQLETLFQALTRVI